MPPTLRKRHKSLSEIEKRTISSSKRVCRKRPDPPKCNKMSDFLQSLNKPVKLSKSEHYKLNIPLDKLFQNISLSKSEAGYWPVNGIEPFGPNDDDDFVDQSVLDPNESADVNDQSEESERFLLLDDVIDRKDEFIGGDFNQDYDVSRILLKNKASNRYLVLWKGYKFIENSWVSEPCISMCTYYIKKFNMRREICYEIFRSLSSDDREKYPGYYDTYVNGIQTRAFVESCLMEEILSKSCEKNGFGDLYVENWTREPGTNPKFTFIAQNVYSPITTYLLEKADNPMNLCECDECTSNEKCPCIKFSTTRNGYLRKSDQPFIMECNKKCKCSEKCIGKLFKHGRRLNFPLMLFKTANRGWGIRTCVKIPENFFVVEYVGLIRHFKECENVQDQTYLFNIANDDGNIEFVVDATHYGNESRFINHSCNPNLVVIYVKGLHSNPSYARLVFFSCREIQPGEELTFNYFTTKEPDLSRGTDNVPKCGCGYKKCRKYLI